MNQRPTTQARCVGACRVDLSGSRDRQVIPAEVLTWWVAGTSRVENHIKARYEDDSDEELTDAVRMVLDKDPSLDAGRVRARALDHTVILEGAVRGEADRRLAALDCWYIPGVEGVDNRLEVLE